MFCESCSEPVEVRDLTRQHNRALRRIVKILRSTVRRGQEKTDSLFLALCDTDPAAELAMRELWESGLFNCGPQDYGYIVNQTIETMSLVKMKFEQSAQAQSQTDAGTCKIPYDGWHCTRTDGHSGPCAAVHIR